MRLLLAEDERDMSNVLTTILKHSGYEVDLAENGQEALDLSMKNNYDCMVMDIMMPVMNGLEAAEKIRALDRPDSETVPIFAMTANAFSDDAARSRKAGMNEHLTKPLDLEKITKAVRKYCKKNSR